MYVLGGQIGAEGREEAEKDLQSNRLPILASEIGAAEAQIRRNANLMAEHVIQAGHRLIEAKALVEHGGWRTWLGERVGMPERTASAYMRIAASGLKSATVADLGIRGALTALGRSKLQLPPPGYLGVIEAGEDYNGVIKPVGGDRYHVRGTWFSKGTPTEGAPVWEMKVTKSPVASGRLLRHVVDNIMGGPIWEMKLVEDELPSNYAGLLTWGIGEVALTKVDAERSDQSEINSLGVLVHRKLMPGAHA